MQFITEKVNLSDEPAENWKSVDYYMPLTSVDETGASDISLAGSSFRGGGFLANSVRDAAAFVVGNNVLKAFIATTERPSEHHSLHDIHVNDFKNEMHCFLYVMTMPF